MDIQLKWAGAASEGGGAPAPSARLAPARRSRTPLLPRAVLVSGSSPQRARYCSEVGLPVVPRLKIFKGAPYCRGIAAFFVAPRGCWGPAPARHPLLSSFPKLFPAVSKALGLFMRTCLWRVEGAAEVSR